MDYKCIIFDCDGVLVESESITAKVLMRMGAELGCELDFETALEAFTGTSMKQNMDYIEARIPGSLPADFENKFRRRSFEAFKTEIEPIEGVRELVQKLKVPMCVASSGPSEKIELNLTTTRLIDHFNGNLFSCYDIGSFKPDPGIYLHAAKQMGFKPEECLVVEDSPSGVKAGIDGGFRVFAYVSNPKNEQRFKDLGATVFYKMSELASFLGLE